MPEVGGLEASAVRIERDPETKRFSEIRKYCNAGAYQQEEQLIPVPNIVIFGRQGLPWEDIDVIHQTW